ncbi:hypothetical protein [Streptomyces atroolivaceus]|uniref:hypothetical protein n=1 Tax=Streptomyces atroolivaceus TaxID=66869 RepID=UPI0036B0CB18
MTAAYIVTRLQTVGSREVAAAHSVVLTVEQFHAGTKHDIVPAEARRSLNLRIRDCRFVIHRYLTPPSARPAKPVTEPGGSTDRGFSRPSRRTRTSPESPPGPAGARPEPDELTEFADF